MRYPIVIERGDDTHAYGVVVPDLPGCFSAGDTLDEAYVMAKEAVEGWLECAIDDGEAIPEPSSMESLAKIDEYQGWILGTVDVDLSKLSDKSERVNITLPRRVLHRLDGLATRGSSSKTPVAKPDGTKMFCSAFLNDARMCCFFANAIVKY